MLHEKKNAFSRFSVSENNITEQQSHSLHVTSNQTR